MEIKTHSSTAEPEGFCKSESRGSEGSIGVDVSDGIDFFLGRFKKGIRLPFFFTEDTDSGSERGAEVDAWGSG